MIPEIEKRNNKVYLVYSDFDFFEPRIISSYHYVTNVTADLLPDNPFIFKLADVFVAKTGYKEIPLYAEQLPEFTEFTPIKPPRKTGYVWRNGSWKKG